ncbi:ABC transporter permease [Agromyces aerolatus]|uniref:ABC transporter permease n=1 Tax=Agromyces sp. LY-1074 TaxID=3074080 RepID=UPI002858307D|nr:MULTISPECIES: ABC transporter permease [unclassified Agromyces]MDR5699329.1 ABC transporter permease [Agromyces sp. LY-1074]MDR5705625.1 ABC transporter permease [Agromyces sp. LY-1358]
MSTLAPAKPGNSRLTALTRYAIVWATLALFVTLALTTPGFFSGANLTNIVHQQAALLIVVAPLTLTLIAGSFDVSLSAIYVTAPLVAIQVGNATGSIPLAVVAGIVTGILCGVLNGVLVVVFHINSFLATLATSFIIFGFAYIASEQSILSPADPAFRELATTRWLGVTTATWMAVGVIAVFWVILARTRYGRYVYATGANRAAAELSGVRTGLIIASTFVAVGAASGFAGVVNASQSMSAQASDSFTFVFSAIAAVVVGGTSISGGSGAVWRSVVGAVFIALLGNGFNLNQVDPILQRIILGVVILLAVGIDAMGRHRRQH